MQKRFLMLLFAVSAFTAMGGAMDISTGSFTDENPTVTAPSGDNTIADSTEIGSGKTLNVKAGADAADVRVNAANTNASVTVNGGAINVGAANSQGNSTLTLGTGTLTNSGAISITGGTVTDKDASITSGSYSQTGGSLNLTQNGNGTAEFTTDSITITGAGTVSVAGGSIDVTNSDGDAAYTMNGTSSLSVTNNGVVTVDKFTTTSSNANAVTINGGSMTVNDTLKLDGTGTLSVTGTSNTTSALTADTLDINSTATFAGTGKTADIDETDVTNGTLNISGGTGDFGAVTIGSESDATKKGIINISGGNSTFTSLSGTENTGSSLSITDGTLSISGADGVDMKNNSLTISGANTVMNITTGNLESDGNVTFTGGKVVVQTGAVTSTGNINVTNGTLIANGESTINQLTAAGSSMTFGATGNTNNALSSSGAVVIKNSGNTASVMTVNGKYNQTAGTLTVQDASQMTVTGAVTAGGNVNINDSAKLMATGGYTQDTGTALTVNGANAEATLGGEVSGAVGFGANGGKIQFQGATTTSGSTSVTIANMEKGLVLVSNTGEDTSPTASNIEISDADSDGNKKIGEFWVDGGSTATFTGGNVIATQDVNVYDDGTLKIGTDAIAKNYTQNGGQLTVGSDSVQGGMITGSTVGTMTVTGDYVQNSGPALFTGNGTTGTLKGNVTIANGTNNTFTVDNGAAVTVGANDKTMTASQNVTVKNGGTLTAKGNYTQNANSTLTADKGRVTVEGVVDTTAGDIQVVNGGSLTATVKTDATHSIKSMTVSGSSTSGSTTTSSSAAFGGTSVTAQGNVVVNNGGKLTIGTDNETTTYTQSAGKLEVSGSNSEATFKGLTIDSTSGGMAVDGATVTATGAVAASKDVTVKNGAQLNAEGTYTQNAGELKVTATSANALAGESSAAIPAFSAGTFTLDNGSKTTFDGEGATADITTANISKGTLNINGGTGSFGAATVGDASEIAGGATYNGKIAITGGDSTFKSLELKKDGVVSIDGASAKVNVTGTDTADGTITNAGSLNVSNGAHITFKKYEQTADTGALVIDGATATVTNSFTKSGAGADVLVKNDGVIEFEGATATLSGIDATDGYVKVSKGGSLTVAAPASGTDPVRMGGLIVDGQSTDSQTQSSATFNQSAAFTKDVKVINGGELTAKNGFVMTGTDKELSVVGKEVDGGSNLTSTATISGTTDIKSTVAVGKDGELIFTAKPENAYVATDAQISGNVNAKEGTLNVKDGASVTFSGTGTQMIGAMTVSGTVTDDGSNTHNAKAIFNSNVEGYGVVSVSDSGSVEVKTGKTYTQKDGTLTVAGGEADSPAFKAETYTLEKGTATFDGFTDIKTANIKGTAQVTQDGGITSGDYAKVTADGVKIETLNVNSGAAYWVSGQNVTNEITGAINSNGFIRVDEGAKLKADAAGKTHSIHNLLVTGTDSAASLAEFGTVTADGDVYATAQGTITATSYTQTAGALNVSGTGTGADDAVFKADTFTQSGSATSTFSGTGYNAKIGTANITGGVANITNGTVGIDNTLQMSGNSEFKISNGSVLDVQGTTAGSKSTITNMAISGANSGAKFAHDVNAIGAVELTSGGSLTIGDAQIASNYTQASGSLKVENADFSVMGEAKFGGKTAIELKQSTGNTMTFTAPTITFMGESNLKAYGDGVAIGSAGSTIKVIDNAIIASHAGYSNAQDSRQALTIKGSSFTLGENAMLDMSYGDIVIDATTTADTFKGTLRFGAEKDGHTIDVADKDTYGDLTFSQGNNGDISKAKFTIATKFADAILEAGGNKVGQLTNSITLVSGVSQSSSPTSWKVSNALAGFTIQLKQTGENAPYEYAITDITDVRGLNYEDYSGFIQKNLGGNPVASCPGFINNGLGVLANEYSGGTCTTKGTNGLSIWSNGSVAGNKHYDLFEHINSGGSMSEGDGKVYTGAQAAHAAQANFQQALQIINGLDNHFGDLRAEYRMAGSLSGRGYAAPIYRSPRYYKTSRARGYRGVDMALSEAANRIWAGVIGQWENTKTQDAISGYKYRSFGVMIGYDRIVGPVTVGGSFAYARGTYTDKGMASNDSHINNYSLNAYVNYYHTTGWWANALLGWNHARNDMKYSTGTGRLEEKYSNNSIYFEAKGGYDWKIGQFRISPSLGLGVIHNSSRAHDAKYQGQAFIRYGRASITSGYLPIRLEGAYRTAVGNGMLEASVNAGYTRMFKKNSPTMDMTLVGLNNSIGYQSTKIKRGANILNLGAGVKYDTGRFEGGVKYDYYHRSKSNAHRLYGYVGIKF